MKREKLFFKSFFVFFIFLCSSPLFAKQNETMYVAVQKAELKSSNFPGFMNKVVGARSKHGPIQILIGFVPWPN